MEQSKKNLFGKRILCVDDSDDSLELLRLVLDHSGAVVSTACSAEEAIEILRRERFDIVISDLSMPPGLDGYDLAHALREMEGDDPLRRETPTVAVSSDAMRPSGKRRFADFQVYMAKPFDQTCLIYVLDRLIAADGEAVASGSLRIWEAKQSTAAAAVATEVAATATTAAKEATSLAAEATRTASIRNITALNAEKGASSASRQADK